MLLTEGRFMAGEIRAAAKTKGQKHFLRPSRTTLVGQITCRRHRLNSAGTNILMVQCRGVHHIVSKYKLTPDITPQTLT